MVSKSFIFISAIIFGVVALTCYADDDIDPFCPYPSDIITWYHYPGDCSLYIECYEGHKYIMKCPKDEYWNEAASTCDYQCNTSDSPNDGTTTPHGEYDDDCPTTGTYYYPHYSDCTKFYQCRNGYKLVLHCTSGYAYSTILNTCDVQENVDCSYLTDSPAPTDSPTNAPTNAPTENPGTTIDYNNCPSSGISYLPNFANCSKFYECNEGEKIDLECQADYAWDIEQATCAKKEEVDCSYVTSGPNPTTAPTSAPATTPSGDDDCPSSGLRYLPHTYNCTKFFKCKDGVKTTLSCQDGYAWSTVLNTCDNREDVDCSYLSTTSNPQTVTQPTGQPNTTPESDHRCANEPDGTLLPVEGDDTRYIECANGKDVEMECANGTTFNESMQRCD